MISGELIVGIGGDVGLSEADEDVCLRVQVDGSAGLSFEGGLEGDVMPTPMPAIDPCLAPRDNGLKSTPSMDRTAGGGVAVRLFLVAVGLSCLALFSPSNAAMTSRRSSSRAASRLMMGVFRDRARFGELFPAMMESRDDQKVRSCGGRNGNGHACSVILLPFKFTLPTGNSSQLYREQRQH